MSMPAESPAASSLSCKTLSVMGGPALRSSSIRNGDMQAHQPASSFPCMLPARLGGDHPR